MCIIIVKPVGKEVPDAHLDNSVENHPHGCGFMYVNKKNRICIFKCLAHEHDRFKKELRKAEKENPDSPFVIHYRKLTHGTAVLDNCHPFRVNKDIAFAHNGTVHPCKPDTANKENKSDTRIFNEKVLTDLPDGWFTSSGVHMLLEDFIGQSKLAILRRDKKVLILNESKGSWSQTTECWYSNMSYVGRSLRQDNNKWPYNTGTGVGADWRNRKKEKKEDEESRPEYGFPSEIGGHEVKYWDWGGIILRFHPLRKEVQAKHQGIASWEHFDQDKQQFVHYPYAIPTPTPAFFKNNKKEEENTKDNVIELPDVQAEEEKDTEEVQCHWCRIKFNKADVDSYETVWGTADLCDDCVIIYEQQKTTTPISQETH